MSASVAIIDSGGANIASLRAALTRLGADSVVTSDAAVIQRAPRVLLPGVGSAHNAMARLRGSGLDKVIPTLKQPLLGICLGMQILFETSEEGPANGLAVIPGNVGKLQFAPGLPVPHMGWNQLLQTTADPLLDSVSLSTTCTSCTVSPCRPESSPWPPPRTAAALPRSFDATTSAVRSFTPNVRAWSARAYSPTS